MSGLFSEAYSFSRIANNFKFNKGSELQNNEFKDAIGLDWYSTRFRILDPQIARWVQIDPKPTFFLSLYCSMSNNPLLYNDYFGDKVKMIGDKESIDEFLKMIEKRTGNTYLVDKAGMLVRTNKKISLKDEEEKTSSILGLLIDNAIKGEKDINMNFTNKDDIRNDNVFIDEAGSSLMDVGDLKRVKSGTLQAALIGHVFAERMVAERNLKNQNVFDKAHELAKETESRIVQYMMGGYFRKRDEKWKYMGYSGKITFSYGKIKYSCFVITDAFGKPTGKMDSDFEQDNW